MLPTKAPGTHGPNQTIGETMCSNESVMNVAQRYAQRPWAYPWANQSLIAQAECGTCGCTHVPTQKGGPKQHHHGCTISQYCLNSCLCVQSGPGRANGPSRLGRVNCVTNHASEPAHDFKCAARSSRAARLCFARVRGGARLPMRCDNMRRSKRRPLPHRLQTASIKTHRPTASEYERHPASIKIASACILRV